MKVYNLRCEHDHRFEGWFSSEQDCSEQLSSFRIACPLCDSTSVSRLPSALRVRSHQGEQPAQPAVRQIQQQVMTLMREMIGRSEDVGVRFAEEARRMHYEETPERPIRGTASREDCEALIDEGIAVLPIPDALKQPLQ